MKFLIFSLLVSAGIFGQTSWGWSVSTKGPNFGYQVEFNSKNFSYQDKYIQKSWPLRACNQKVFAKVQKDFQTNFKQRIEVKGKFPDQITYVEDKKSKQIAQSSPFGIFLTQFPNRIISLVGEEEQACKGQPVPSKPKTKAHKK